MTSPRRLLELIRLVIAAAGGGMLLDPGVSPVAARAAGVMAAALLGRDGRERIAAGLEDVAHRAAIDGAVVAAETTV